MRLRALEPEDLELLYTIENNRDLWWIGAQTAPLSRYHLHNYIANNEGDIFKDEQVRFIIDQEGVAVGIIDIFNFSPLNSRAEIGIALLAEYQGRGLAKEAICQLAQYAREVVSMHQIYAVVPKSNQASLNMLNGAGFRISATLPDWIRHCGKYEEAILMNLVL